MSKRSLEKMTLEELQAEQAELAEVRHELMLRQRDVEERIQVAKALEGLSPTIRARLTGESTAEGMAN
jgi:hypothetical protein